MLAYCHSDRHHHSFRMDTSGMLQWRDMLIVPLQQSHVSCSLWVTFFPSFHMMNCPPFERTLNVKKQQKFELICLLVDYLHICLSKDVLILLHRLKYLGATVCWKRIIKAIYLLKLLTVPKDFTICLCDDYSSWQTGKALKSSLKCRRKKVTTFGDKGAVKNQLCVYVLKGF